MKKTFTSSPFLHATGYTRQQHYYLQKGLVMQIDHDGRVGFGPLPEQLYYVWGRPDFHDYVKIAYYDRFIGWDPDFDGENRLVYQCINHAWEFVLPHGLTLADYLNYYDNYQFPEHQSTDKGDANILLASGSLPVIQFVPRGQTEMNRKSFKNLKEAIKEFKNI